MSSKADAEVERLKRKKYNKKCFTCANGNSSYVLTPHYIFVCHTCSGILREKVGYKARGISMTTWTQKDVADLKNGGNKAAKKTWLGKYDEDKNPKPVSQQDVRKFIDDVFEKKKYYKKRKSGRKSETKAHAEEAARAAVAASTTFSLEDEDSAPEPVVPAKSGSAPTGGGINFLEFVVDDEGPTVNEPEKTEEKEPQKNAVGGLGIYGTSELKTQPPEANGKSFGAVVTDIAYVGRNGSANNGLTDMLGDLIDQPSGKANGGTAVDALVSEFKRVMEHFNIMNRAEMESTIQSAMTRIYGPSHAPAPAPAFNGGLDPAAAFNGGPTPTPVANNARFAPAPMPKTNTATPWGANEGPFSSNTPKEERSSGNPFDAVDNGQMSTFDPSMPNPFAMAPSSTPFPTSTTTDAPFAPAPASSSSTKPTATPAAAPEEQSQPPQEDLFSFADPFKNM